MKINTSLSGIWLMIGIFCLSLVGCTVTTTQTPNSGSEKITITGQATVTTTSPVEVKPPATGNSQQTGLDGETTGPSVPAVSTPNSPAAPDKGSGSAVEPPKETDKPDKDADAEVAAAEKKLNAWKGGKLSPAKFAELFGPLARASQKKTGVPASVTLAQAALETGWGAHTIGDAKNMFGIKGTGPAGSIKVPTKEFVNGRYITIQANFRKYNTWQQSIDDHAKLLQGKRYKNCMAHKNDPKQFAREVQKAGYATSPTYASTLISIMSANNFYKWDK